MAIVWSVRYALAVNRLASGVGDVTFYGADGRPWFRLDERRRDVPLEQISPYLQEALIATEDRRFYYHPGIDPVGLLRAVRDNVRRGEAVEGASTLTQQLARTLFLSNARTVGRKGKEAVIALMLEVRLTKSQILELYLNRVFLSAGVYGVEAMSTSLFGKHASDLTLAEAALIAGLVKAPSALSPWSNFDGAVRRSDHVLARMRAAGFITDADLRVGEAAAAEDPAVPGAARGALRVCEGISAPAVPRPLRRRPAAGLGGPHDRAACAAGHRRAVGRERSRPARHSGPAGRARRARSRTPATCWRSSADATSASRRSIAPRAAGVSPGRHSSRSSTPSRCSAG